MKRRFNLMIVTIILFLVLTVIGTICVGKGAEQTKKGINHNTNVVNSLIDKTK